MLILPYFAGERTPLFDSQSRGTIFGLTLRHRRAHLFRAFLEATAFGARHNLPIEAVRGEYRAMLPKLIASANPDRIHWLEHLPVKPVADGSFAITGARLIDVRGGPPI